MNVHVFRVHSTVYKDKGRSQVARPHSNKSPPQVPYTGLVLCTCICNKAPEGSLVIRSGSIPFRSVVQKAPSPLSQSKWEQEQATEQETSAGHVQGKEEQEEMEQGAEEKVTSLDADDPFCLNELIQQEAD